MKKQLTHQQRIDQLKGRIESMCTHFNGVYNEQCRAGIAYNSVGTINPCMLPCLKQGGECGSSKFVPAEEAEKEARETLAVTPSMYAKEDIFNQQLKTGKLRGEIPCRCGGTLKYYTRKAKVYAYCSVCGIDIK